MSDMLKKKLEIARRAGALEDDVASLEVMKEKIRSYGYPVDGRGNDLPTHEIEISIGFSYSNTVFKINSKKWFGDKPTLHDALIAFIQPEINKREAEIDDLIKVML